VHEYEEAEGDVRKMIREMQRGREVLHGKEASEKKLRQEVDFLQKVCERTEFSCPFCSILHPILPRIWPRTFCGHFLFVVTLKPCQDCIVSLVLFLTSNLICVCCTLFECPPQALRSIASTRNSQSSDFSNETTHRSMRNDGHHMVQRSVPPSQHDGGHSYMQWQSSITQYLDKEAPSDDISHAPSFAGPALHSTHNSSISVQSNTHHSPNNPISVVNNTHKPSLTRSAPKPPGPLANEYQNRTGASTGHASYHADSDAEANYSTSGGRMYNNGGVNPHAHTYTHMQNELHTEGMLPDYGNEHYDNVCVCECVCV